MIVVVDTSVFVSGLIGPRGASREVLRLCLNGSLDPLMGAALYWEYESLLGRTGGPLERSALDPSQLEKVLNAFLSVCRWVRVFYLWRPNLPDEADNHLIELAMAGQAEAIVTKNTRDFIRGELRFPGLRILRPEQLLEEVR